MKRWWPWAVRLAVSAAALFLALEISATLSDQPRLQSPDPVWLLVAFAGHVIIVALLSLRLGLTLFLLDGTRLTARQLVVANWASLAVGQIALGTLSGDAVRIVAVARAGARWGDAVAAIVADRLIGLLALVLLGIGALSVVLGTAPGALIIGAVTACCIIGLLVLRALSLHPLHSKLGARLSQFAALLWRLACRPGGWSCLGLALVAHALTVAVFYATARAFGLFPPLPETIVAVPAGLLSSVLPVSFGGWGIRELSIAGTYQALNVNFAAAVSASVLFGVINIAFNLPGLLALWHGFGAFRRSDDENQS